MEGLSATGEVVPWDPFECVFGLSRRHPRRRRTLREDRHHRWVHVYPGAHCLITCAATHSSITSDSQLSLYLLLSRLHFCQTSLLSISSSLILRLSYAAHCNVCSKAAWGTCAFSLNGWCVCRLCLCSGEGKGSEERAGHRPVHPLSGPLQELLRARRVSVPQHRGPALLQVHTVFCEISLSNLNVSTMYSCYYWLLHSFYTQTLSDNAATNLFTLEFVPIWIYSAFLICAVPFAVNVTM